MKTNMGTADRIIRIIIVAVIAALFFSGVISGTVGIILLILGAIFLLTVVINWCPIYYPFKISTAPKKK